MNKNAIYHKSAKGVEAIATRQHGLGPRQRSLLILIDGKKSFDDLAKLSAMLGDTAKLLDELEAGGFIEVAAAATPASSPGPAAATQPVTAPSPLASALPATSLPDAKRFAVRKLTDTMGPMAEELCLRIEAARTPNEFLAAVTRAEVTLRQLRGSTVAAAFAAEVAAHSPSA
ncbi:MAG: hypothetical protein AB7P37_04515 [Ramlibacter sp.]